MTTSDWKTAHANKANELAEHPLVEDVLQEFADNMGFKLEGLPNYGMRKIVSYVAQVVLARASGFDPDLLRLTDEEATEIQLKILRMFEEAGKPVVVVVGTGTCTDCNHPSHDRGCCFEVIGVHDPGPGQWEEYCLCGISS